MGYLLQGRERKDRIDSMKANPDFTLRTIGDISLLVSLTAPVFQKEQMITTNESGVLLWERLAEECTQEELAEVLQDVYEIDRDTALADTSIFLDSLRRAGALLE